MIHRYLHVFIEKRNKLLLHSLRVQTQIYYPHREQQILGRTCARFQGLSDTEHLILSGEQRPRDSGSILHDQMAEMVTLWGRDEFWTTGTLTIRLTATKHIAGGQRARFHPTRFITIHQNQQSQNPLEQKDKGQPIQSLTITSFRGSWAKIYIPSYVYVIMFTHRSTCQESTGTNDVRDISIWYHIDIHCILWFDNTGIIIQTCELAFGLRRNNRVCIDPDVLMFHLHKDLSDIQSPVSQKYSCVKI